MGERPFGKINWGPDLAGDVRVMNANLENKNFISYRQEKAVMASEKGNTDERGNFSKRSCRRLEVEQDELSGFFQS